MTTATPLLPARGTQVSMTDPIARVESDPGDVAAWRMLVGMMMARGALADAIAAQQRVVALSPGDPEALSELGRLQIAAGARSTVVLASLDRALQVDPMHQKTWIRKGMYLLHQARLDEAGACFGQVLKRAPEHVGARAGAALVLDRLGDFETAWELLERTQGRPTTSFALASATVAMHMKTPEKAIPVVRRCCKRADGYDRSMLDYALGDLQDAAGQYTQAWRSWERANQGRQLHFDQRAHERAIQAIVQLTRVPLQPVGPSDERPVFVVGMPRSGTTLLETLLDAHSGIHGIGESHAISQIAERIPEIYGKTSYLEVLDRIPEIGDQLGAAYLEELDRLAPDAIRVIDKMPNNAMHLGLISCILPGARVIWCERDDDDVLVSCFQKSLGAGLPWATTVSDIRCWQRNLQKLKAHWEATLPLQILTVRYEEMVADPMGEAQRITGFLGVPFERAMLDFHENRRQVATASFDQINEPIHSRRVGRAARFRAFLE